jgi:hypothetical protein
VASLNAFQRADVWHPFTCSGGGGAHSDAVLTAEADGWRCPVGGCRQRQRWALALMADWSWRELATHHEPNERYIYGDCT